MQQGVYPADAQMLQGPSPGCERDTPAGSLAAAGTSEQVWRGWYEQQ